MMLKQFLIAPALFAASSVAFARAPCAADPQAKDAATRCDNAGDTCIAASDLPPESLLQSYREAGAYTDCYWIEITAAVAQADYVEAFYTTWVFKLERRLLAWFIAGPSTDAQARALGRSERDTFVPCWGFTAFTHACCCALRFRV